MPCFISVLRTKQTFIWHQFKAGVYLANILPAQLITKMGGKKKNNQTPPKRRLLQYQANVTKANVLSQVLQRTD